MIAFDKQLEQYILDHCEPESDLLKELNRQTHLKMIHPRMLSGHLQGRILSMISKMIQPEHILEIGTFTGYSALCLAEGLADKGKIVTLEKDDEIADFAMEYFRKAGIESNIEMHIGDASAIIGTLDYTFDLVYIDADKKQYIDNYEAALKKTRKGGFLIADNVLWSAKVVDNNEQDDPETKAIIEFNAKIQHDDRVENVLFPVRDGLMIMRKKI